MYTQAQRHIIQFYTDRYLLLRTLRLFHSFYLLGAGDFYLEFISRVEHGFLFAPATVSNGWFQEEFNTCVGRTSLCGEAEFISQRVRLKPLTSLSRFDIWKKPFFSMDMPENLRVVFTPGLMAKYEQIFSVLMVLRTQLFDLERVWTDECSLAKEVDALRDRDTVRALRRTLDEFNLLRMQAHAFLTTLQGFYFLHVVEKLYNNMMVEMGKAERFDDVLRIHREFVEGLDKSFFTDGKQSAIKSVMFELLRLASGVLGVQVGDSVKFEA